MPVDRVAVHALEYRGCSLIASMITSKPGVTRTMDAAGPRRVRGAGDGEAAIGLLQRGRVVDAVARHTHDMVVLLQHVDDMKFMLGEDLGEAVGVLDRLGDRGRFVRLGIAQRAAVEDIGAHPQGPWPSPGRSPTRRRSHLDLHAHFWRRSRSWPPHPREADRTAVRSREIETSRRHRPARRRARENRARRNR